MGGVYVGVGVCICGVRCMWYVCGVYMWCVWGVGVYIWCGGVYVVWGLCLCGVYVVCVCVIVWCVYVVCMCIWCVCGVYGMCVNVWCVYMCVYDMYV